MEIDIQESIKMENHTVTVNMFGQMETHTKVILLRVPDRAKVSLKRLMAKYTKANFITI